MTAGALQRAANPPTTAWIMIAIRLVAANRRTLRDAAVVLNAVSAVPEANAMTATAIRRWTYSTRGSHAREGSQLPLQSGQSFPHPDPAGCNRATLPIAMSASVERTVASANRYTRAMQTPYR